MVDEAISFVLFLAVFVFSLLNTLKGVVPCFTTSSQVKKTLPKVRQRNGNNCKCMSFFACGLSMSVMARGPRRHFSSLLSRPENGGRQCLGSDRRYQTCEAIQCGNVPPITITEFAEQICRRAKDVDKDLTGSGFQRRSEDRKFRGIYIFKQVLGNSLNIRNAEELGLTGIIINK